MGREPSAAGRPSGRATVVAMVVVAVLVLTALVIGVVAVRRYEDYLSGYWVGEPSFLEDADLSDMQLFLAPAEGGRRQGYLIIADLEGALISNQAIEVRERAPVQRWATALRSAFAVSRDAYSARRVEIAYDAAPAMPEQLKMSLSVLDGTLTLYGGDAVYAFLTKDGPTSAAALAEWAAGPDGPAPAGGPAD